MNKNRMIKAAAGIFMITVLSKLFGFFREILIAYRFGSGLGTDAFFVAESIFGVITGLAGAGLGMAIIPVVSRIRSEGDLDTEKKYIGQLVAVFSLAALALMCLSYVLAMPLIKLFAIGFTGYKLQLAVRLLRLGLPIVLFNFVFAIMISYNHTKDRFLIPAFNGIVMNIPIIVYLLFWYGRFGIEGLVSTWVLSNFIRVLFLYVPVRKDITVSRNIDWSNKYLKNTFDIMLPIIFTSMVGYINLAVDKTLASRLAEGSISALNYAARTKGIVTSLFIASIVTVIYPQISKSISESNFARTRKMFAYGMNMVFIITIPAMAGILIMSYPLVKIIFYRGAFDEFDVLMTSSALLFYTVGIVGNGSSLLINKLYYAYHDSKTIMKIGVTAVGLNIVLNLILVRYMGHRGLALATSVAALYGASLKFYLLKEKGLELNYRSFANTIGKVVASAAVMGIVVYILAFRVVDMYSGLVLERFAKLIGVCGFGAVVYVTMTYVLKVDEVLEVIRKAMSKFKRNKAD